MLSMMQSQGKSSADSRKENMTLLKSIITFMLCVPLISVLMTSLLLSLGTVGVLILILKTGQAIKRLKEYGITKVMKLNQSGKDIQIID